MGGIAGAQRHKGRRYRNAVLVRKPPHGLGRVGVDYAAAGIDQRAFRFRQHGIETFTGIITEVVRLDLGEAPSVALQRQRAGSLEGPFPVLDVFGDVDDDRPRTAGASKFERAAYGCFEFLGVRHKKNVLRDGAHNGSDGRFLECIGTNCCSGHLAADHNHRDGVGHAVADGSDGIGGSRTRSNHDDADFAACSCIPGSHKPRALFVGRDDQLHGSLGIRLNVMVVVAEYGIVDWQDGTTRVAKDRSYALSGHDLDHGISARERFTCARM